MEISKIVTITYQIVQQLYTVTYQLYEQERRVSDGI